MKEKNMKTFTLKINDNDYVGDIIYEDNNFQLVNFNEILPIESNDYYEIKTFFPNFHLEIGEYMNNTYRICCNNSVMLTKSESKNID